MHGSLRDSPGARIVLRGCCRHVAFSALVSVSLGLNARPVGASGETSLPPIERRIVLPASGAPTAATAEEEALADRLLPLVEKTKIPRTGSKTLRAFQAPPAAKLEAACRELETQQPAVRYCEASDTRGELLTMRADAPAFSALASREKPQTPKDRAKNVRIRLERLGITRDQTSEPSTTSKLAINRWYGNPTEEVANKVFVMRALRIDNQFPAIPILGSRVVFTCLDATCATDESLTKTLAIWPQLAPDGHVLTTSQSAQSIADRVASDLFRLGLGDFGGDYFMRPVYIPAEDTDGPIHLRLQLEVTLSPKTPTGAKTRVVSVALDP